MCPVEFRSILKGLQASLFYEICLWLSAQGLFRCYSYLPTLNSICFLDVLIHIFYPEQNN